MSASKADLTIRKLDVYYNGDPGVERRGLTSLAAVLYKIVVRRHDARIDNLLKFPRGFLAFRPRSILTAWGDAIPFKFQT